MWPLTHRPDVSSAGPADIAPRARGGLLGHGGDGGSSLGAQRDWMLDVFSSFAIDFRKARAKLRQRQQRRQQ